MSVYVYVNMKERGAFCKEAKCFFYQEEATEIGTGFLTRPLNVASSLLANNHLNHHTEIILSPIQMNIPRIEMYFTHVVVLLTFNFVS